MPNDHLTNTPFGFEDPALETYKRMDFNKKPKTIKVERVIHLSPEEMERQRLSILEKNKHYGQ